MLQRENGYAICRSRPHSFDRKPVGRDNGKPGLRADYGPTYYAALLGPDGNNVEAVCLLNG
jgi:hypothetical protein